MSGFVLIALMVAGQEGEPPSFFDGPPAHLEERKETGPPAGPTWEFPTLMSVLDLERWRQNDDLQFLRERAGDATLGVPLFVPQAVFEEFIPRGLPIGPSTFLYRDSKDSRALPLVVFDQAMFHEAEFLEEAQVQSDSWGWSRDSYVGRSQEKVLRRSLNSGFRACYSLPPSTLSQVADAVQEQGFWGYLLVPPAGALFLMRGIDQKFVIEDVLEARVRVFGVRRWKTGLRSPDGTPVAACEIRIGHLPLSLVFSVDMTDHGPTAQFVGLGGSLGDVGELLGLDMTRNLRPNQ